MTTPTENLGVATVHDAIASQATGGDAPCFAQEPQIGAPMSADGARADATIHRLAQLDQIDYDRVRKQEAEALGIRTSTLDQSVAAARKRDMPNAEGGPTQWQIEPWPEPVDPVPLLNEIAAAVGRFVICRRETTYAVALWVAMTWFMEVVQVSPIALITAPEKRCGKSVLLSFMGKLVCRPLSVSSVTPAALFRAIEKWRPTMLIDEADTFMQDNEALRGIVNAGHTRETAGILRCTGDDHEPTWFNTWGAKAIAGIGGLPGTITDRSVMLQLRRKLPQERTEKLRHASGLFAPLARKLARFAADNQQAVAQYRPSLLDDLNDRAQDNWEPLMSIAHVAGGHWPERARQAALALSASDTPSLGTTLLADIRRIFDESDRDRISTEDLLAALCADVEGPWAEYRHGQPMTPSQLAKELSAYGIKSQTVRWGSHTAKGYLLHHFVDAFARYVADTSATADTPSHHSEHAPLGATATPSCAVTASGSVTAKPVQDKAGDGVTATAETTATMIEVYL